MDKVYFAHPYGGKRTNKILARRKITWFGKKNKDKEFISPIHIFEKQCNVLPYLEGMDLCFELLDSCDEVWLPENFMELNSIGCIMKYGYAKAKNKKIVFYKF